MSIDKNENYLGNKIYQLNDIINLFYLLNAL